MMGGDILESASKEWVQEWCNSNFVKKDKCNERQESNNRKFANDDTRIKLFEQKISMWSKLFWIIAGATAGQFAATLFELLGGIK